MKSLQDYILAIKKEHPIKIRFAFELDDKMMDRLEKFLGKYDLKEIGSPKKTIFQKNPLGFQGPINSEIYIVDAIVGIPVATDDLRLSIAQLFKVAQNYVAVHNAHDDFIMADRETYNKQDPEYVSKLQNTPEYPEDELKPDHKDIYGNEYNEEMAKTLDDARSEAKKNINNFSKE